MTRRGNGEGHPRKRAEGRWELQIMVGGVRRSIYGKTRQEVLRKKKELDLTPRAHTAETVGELAALWQANVVEPHRARLTALTYDQYLRLHILPALGEKRLGDVRPADVERWVADLRRSGLAPGSVSAAQGILKNLLNYAVRTERLARNPAALVPVAAATSREVPPLTPTAARALVAALREDAYGPIFLTMLTLGLRRGEALGLRWDDLDFENATVRVRKQLKRVPHEGFQHTDLKSRASRRDLHLPPQMAELFNAQWVKQHHECWHYSVYGKKYDDWRLVFRTPEGRPVCPRNTLARLKRALARAGLDTGLRLHDLRHHHASILFAGGLAPKEIQEQLGHASLGVTMNVYTHLLPQARKAASERVWGYLEGE